MMNNPDVRVATFPDIFPERLKAPADEKKPACIRPSQKKLTCHWGVRNKFSGMTLPFSVRSKSLSKLTIVSPFRSATAY